MSDYDILNGDISSFISRIDAGEGTKIATAAGLAIAEKLRERSFARQVMTPHQVSRHGLQRDEDHDQLYLLDEKEVPTAPAKALNFRAMPDADYVYTPRYRINIFEIAARVYEKKELELLASQQPVIKTIEENTVREIEEVEDGYFLQYVDAAAAQSGNLIVYSTGQGGAVTKGAIKAGMNAITGHRLIAKTLLIPHLCFNDFVTLTYADVGSDLLREITVEGYKYYDFLGLKLIVSIKNELFLHPTITLASGDPARMIYFFADEKALGRFIVLESTKFSARRVHQTIQWTAWEYIGMGIGNANAVARVTLAD